MTFKQLADKYIPGPINQEFFYKDGNTGDIATKTLRVFQQHNNQVKALAPHLRGRTVRDTCYNVWRLIKENITYRVDPEGEQWVRRPARLWYDKEGDCKSYSVMAASLLLHLGIRPCFRFVLFPGYKVPTHVYVVVLNQGREIIIDAVMPGFNREKPYKQKFDYNMTRISELAGLPRSGRHGAINGGLSTALNKGARRKVLDQALPGLAMLALYQFIPAGPTNTFSDLLRGQFGTPDDLLSGAPEIVKQKRLKSFESFWDFGDWADIKVENEVFPRVKQLLTAQLGMDPFQWWRLQLRKPANVTGIGVDPATIAIAAKKVLDTVSKVFAGIKSTLGKLFGGSDIKWKRGDPSTWAPDVSDWNSYRVNPLGGIPVTGTTNTGAPLPVTYVPPPSPPTQQQQPAPYTPPAEEKKSSGLGIAAAVAAALMFLR